MYGSGDSTFGLGDGSSPWGGDDGGGSNYGGGNGYGGGYGGGGGNPFQGFGNPFGNGQQQQPGNPIMRYPAPPVGGGVMSGVGGALNGTVFGLPTWLVLVGGVLIVMEMKKH